MAKISWRPRYRNYEQELQKHSLSGEETDSHPLQGIVTTVTSSKVKQSKSKSKKEDSSSSSASMVSDPLSSGNSDPLSMPVSSDPLSAALLDPLSQAASEVTSSFAKPEKQESRFSQVSMDSGFEPWSMKRTSILSTYTTSETIPITTSFLSEEERTKLETKAQSAVTDNKVKRRLEQLDDMEEGSVKETLNLSQKDYIKKIDDLNRSLVTAWDNDQRVKALKIAIQCSKLLSDTSVIQFYPSKFVLITDILDNFGFLVFDRIRRKSQYVPPGSIKPIMLPENFTSDQVPESGKETCRNWFYKIASIRELLPRFYVETAILKCYSFLTDREYTQALLRLTRLVRGIGDPLVACYARAYLSRVGMSVAPDTKNHLMPNFKDYLKTVDQLLTDHVQNTLALQSLDLQGYVTLFVPAVDWIMQCIAYKSSEQLLEEVLESMKSVGVVSAHILNAIINNFQSDFVSSRAIRFADMIRDCEEAGMPKYKLFASLGHCVVASDPPQKDRLPLLNSVWKSVVKFDDSSHYMACTHIWMEYVAKHFSRKEVNTLLEDVIKHMLPDRAFEKHYSNLVSIISRIVTHMTDYAILFSMDKFLPFIDLFQKEETKVEVCKTIVGAFNINQTDATSDPLIINGITYLCKVIHDSLDSLSIKDERRQASSLVCGFVRKVDFGHDFEQQLSFYVDVRGNFSNLDTVLIFLVQNVNRLAMETRRLVKGNHTRKTAAFVRACAAYCFIVIPSLEDTLAALDLYLLSGHVSIANGALSQGDAFLRAACSSLKDVPEYVEKDGKRLATEIFVYSFVTKFMSTLLVVPDNPEKDVLNNFRELLNSITEYKWQEKTDRKFKVYISAMSLLAAYCQDQYLYGITRVDSNDSLYASDKKFVKIVAGLVDTLISQVLDHLKTLAHPEENYMRQASLALNMFLVLLASSEVSQDTGVSTLLANLWNLAQKHSILDANIMEKHRRSVKRRQGSEFKSLLSELA